MFDFGSLGSVGQLPHVGILSHLRLDKPTSHISHGIAVISTAFDEGMKVFARTALRRSWRYIWTPPKT